MNVLLMPQSRRLTVYWRGLGDRVEIKVGRRKLVARGNSATIEGLEDRAYDVSINKQVFPVVLAPQGQERAANAHLPQGHLVYALLHVGPEVDPFADLQDQADAPPIICVHCRHEVTWLAYRLCCVGCGAEFVPAGIGAYLDVSKLRFGTCACCLPKRILIQTEKTQPIVCAQTLKAHDKQGARYVVIDAQNTVFDAAQIDMLLDQGMAEIATHGVSRSAQ